MKKLLTIMLAVLLAALAVAASAEDTVKNADIIIVGAGGGGLSAAIEAVNDGAQSVIVLEKTGKTGGSLNFTSGSMSGAETVIQKIDGIEDTKESFVQDILNNGAHLGNEAMIRAFVDEDVDAIQWLWDNGLSEYNFSSMKTTGKHTVFAPEHQLYSVARTYKPSANDPTRYKAAAHEIMDTVLATDAYKGVTIDFNTDISWEELLEIEAKANQYLYENHPIDIQFHRGAELEAIDYRSKKALEGDVRIVAFPGADCCACCGTHTATTGQVGQIKILAAENYKGGVRLSIVCGGRALEAAQAMRARQAEIGALLSAKASETANAVHRVYDEYTALKFTHFGLCSQLFDALAAQVTPGADAIRIVPGLDPDGLHRLAVRLSEATTGLCAALTPNEKGTGYCLAQAGGDVRALTKALNAALNGRGGGKPGICQGSCAAEPEQVEEFLRKTK